MPVQRFAPMTKDFATMKVRALGSHETRRWKEVDSNFRFPAMVNLVVVAFVPRGCSGWIGAPGREYRGSARLSCAVSPPRCRRIRVG